MEQRSGSEVIAPTSLYPIALAAHAALSCNSSSHTQGVEKAASRRTRIKGLSLYKSAMRTKSKNSILDNNIEMSMISSASAASP